PRSRLPGPRRPSSAHSPGRRQAMTMTEPRARFLTLKARTAADLMTEHVISIPEFAPLHEAIAVLTDRGFSGAPVINEAGRPVGVISRSDILVHDRNDPVYAKRKPEYHAHS